MNITDFYEWPAICSTFGITEEHEREFVRGITSSHTDALYYEAMYHKKYARFVELRDKTRALLQDAHDFDESLSARLAERIAGDLDVVGAARDLTLHRLDLRDRAAECEYAELGMWHNFSHDRYLSDTAAGAGRAMTDYLIAARTKHDLAQEVEGYQRDRGAAPAFMQELWALWRSRPPFPATDTLPSYTGKSPSGRREYAATHARQMARSAAALLLADRSVSLV